MAFDDKLGSVFPTRQGTPAGSSVERVMLQSSGGASGIVKRYMTQPDGSVVRLETRNGMPVFIRAKEVASPSDGDYLQMDSGIIDLISIHEGSPNFSLPALIYDTDYVAAQAIGERAVGCGKIRTSDATGEIIPNGSAAESYSSSSKKVISSKTPASMFTGKMRLYVQALYGGVWSDLTLSNGFDGRPTLVISLSGEEESTTLTTSTGIYTDPLTCEHYIIWPHSASATVRKLKATTKAEKFRKFILPTSTLGDADKQRIEAYILSQSFPDKDTTQTVTYSTTPTEALGYSFHFNYDGTACDIVDVEEVYVEALSAWGFRTTHYRINFTFTNGTCSAEQQVVYGPHEWSVNRNSNVVAFPTWNGYLTKAGQSLSGSRTASQIGRVYAYYKKNELVTVDVSITKESVDPDVRVSEPEFFGGTTTSTGASYIVIEGQGGKSELRTSRKKSSLYFTCGSAIVGGEDRSESVSSVEMEWVGREGWGYAGSGETVLGGLSSFDLPYGIPTLDITWNEGGSIQSFSRTYQLDTVPSGLPWDKTLAVISAYSYTLTWKRTDCGLNESTAWKTVVVIPYLDAEAVYLGEKKFFSRFGTKTTAGVRSPGGGSFGNPYRGLDYTVTYATTPGGEGTTYRTGPIHYVAYAAVHSSDWGNGNVSGVTPGVEDVQEGDITSGTFTLKCANGAFSAVLPNIDRFFAPSATAVEGTYETRESVNGVTHSPYTTVEQGSPVFPTNFTLVGWA